MSDNLKKLIELIENRIMKDKDVYYSFLDFFIPEGSSIFCLSIIFDEHAFRAYSLIPEKLQLTEEEQQSIMNIDDGSFELTEHIFIRNNKNEIIGLMMIDTLLT